MKKYLIGVVLMCGLWIGFSGVWIYSTIAQAATQSLTDQANFYWDTVTVDTLGGPVTVSSYEFSVWTGTVIDPNAGGVATPVKITAAAALAAPSLSAISAFGGLKGGTYTAAVRALSLSGTTTLRGPYSAPISLQFSRPAAAPQNLRLTIIVVP